MDEISQKVSKTIIEYVKDVQQHINIEKAILYGSHAKGDYSKDSDVDIAIFSESFRGGNIIEINTFLFSLARKYKDICIEPIGFDSSDLYEENSFIQEILNTGHEIFSN